MPYPVRACKITFNPDTGYYGYAFRFSGRKPHYQMETCDSLQNALASVDPHKEMVWEEPSDADESCVMFSRRYRPGSVLYRMTGMKS